MQLGDSPNERLANVVLFVPLGLATWFAAPRWAWIAAGAAAPFVLESVQGSAPDLGRACDASDVLANLFGFGLGLVLSSSVRRDWVWRL